MNEQQDVRIVEHPLGAKATQSEAVDREPQSLVSIPKDATCQERHQNAGHRYFPCGKPAVAIVRTEQARLRGDKRHYFMCAECSISNLKHYGGHVVFTEAPALLKVMRPQQQIAMAHRVALADKETGDLVKDAGRGTETITVSDLP